MQAVVPYVKGFVRLRFWCEKPERFLNLCAHHQITIRHLLMEQDSFVCELPLEDVKKLKTICRKTHTRLRIIGKYGLPFFFYRNKKRKAFFMGILVCLSLLAFLSTRVWNIHVEGNYSNSTQVILRFLEEKEIHHGIAKKEVSCSQIAAWIRGQYPDITWVSARLVGTRLLITIQENEVVQKSEAKGEPLPCDLVAERDGQIVKMITRQGVPAVEAGSLVKKGDLLVSGQLPILNDAQEVVRYAYVQADADVYLRYGYSYVNSFPLVYEKRQYTGRTKESCFFQLGTKRFSLRMPGTPFAAQDSISRARQMYLTENFMLPVTYGRVTEMEYVRKKEKFTKEEAYDRAQKELICFLEKLLEKGVQICENNVKIKVSQTDCTASGELILMAPVGTRRPITEQYQPEAVNERERTAPDE